MRRIVILHLRYQIAVVDAIVRQAARKIKNLTKKSSEDGDCSSRFFFLTSMFYRESLQGYFRRNNILRRLFSFIPHKLEVMLSREYEYSFMRLRYLLRGLTCFNWVQFILRHACHVQGFSFGNAKNLALNHFLHSSELSKKMFFRLLVE